MFQENSLNRHEALDLLLDISITSAEYKKILSECTTKQMQDWMKKVQATPFPSMFDQADNIATLKINTLFENAHRLEINPNTQFNPLGSLPQHVVWNNTPLHNFIANERYGLVHAFLEASKKYGFEINLNIKEREGKTPFMLAVKMGNAPLNVAENLITAENYNMPDDTGVTPIMMASAMRRIDIIKLIIQQEANRLSLGKLDFEQLTKQQLEQLQPFMNQQHPETGKSIAHFAVLRDGIEAELQKPDSYQQTIINIAKSVGIDARRDEKVYGNAPTNDTGAPIVMSLKEIKFFNAMKQEGATQQVNLRQFGLEQDLTQVDMVFSHLTYRGVEKIERALLASKKNAFLLMSKTLGENKNVYKNVPTQIKSYSGTTYLESVLSRTEETILFLHSLGLDFSLKQKHENKSPRDYIATLMLPKNKNSISTAEERYIFPVCDKLKTLAENEMVLTDTTPKKEDLKDASLNQTTLINNITSKKIALISGKTPSYIKVADKPLLLGGKVENLTLDQFKEKFGYSYGEGIWYDESSNVSLQEISQAKESLGTELPTTNIQKQIKHFLENPPDHLIICKINDKVGYGLFTAKKILRNTVIFIYSGEICRPRRDKTGLSAEYYNTNFCYKPVDYRGFASFMQHLPTKQRAPNIEMLYKIAEMTGQKIDKNHLRLDNTLYNLTFRSNDTKENLALENVNREYLKYQNYPVIAFISNTDIPEGSQLGFKYGPDYELALAYTPEIFDKRGAEVPHTVYKRIFGALYFASFTYIGEFPSLISQLQKKDQIRLKGTDGKLHLVSSEELSKALMQTNALSAEEIVKSKSEIKSVEINPQLLTQYGLDKQKNLVEIDIENLKNRLQSISPDIHAKWKYNPDKNIFWITVNDKKPVEQWIKKYNLNEAVTSQKVLNKEAYCFMVAPERLIESEAFNINTKAETTKTAKKLQNA